MKILLSLLLSYSFPSFHLRELVPQNIFVRRDRKNGVASVYSDYNSLAHILIESTNDLLVNLAWKKGMTLIPCLCLYLFIHVL